MVAVSHDIVILCMCACLCWPVYLHDIKKRDALTIIYLNSGCSVVNATVAAVFRHRYASQYNAAVED